MSDLKTIRGMPDLYGKDIEAISVIEKTCKEVFLAFNYSEIRTPLIEYKSLFERSVGESSEIIQQKEVFELDDRKGEMLCLRPEGTAGLVRSLITNGLDDEEIKKFFYIGPMFRYERPQKGRKRQFFQAGAELIGEESTKSDVEIILLAKTILEKLNVKYTLEINYLGKEDSLNSYRSYLRKYLQNFKDELSEKVYSRLQRNPIRAIDSKDSNIQEIFKKASDISDFLKKEEKESFERTIKSLKDLKIDFNLNKNLVRGLDYYTGTVFEFTVDGLGAQNAVIGGGRYDNLIKDLGGRDLPAIGFALGIDRLAEIINVTTRKKDIFIGSVDDDSINFAQYIGNKLRENIKGLVVENYLGNANVAKQLKKANSQGFKFAIIVGQEEQNTNSFKLKNLLDGSENTLNEIELVEFLNGW